MKRMIETQLLTLVACGLNITQIKFAGDKVEGRTMLPYYKTIQKSLYKAFKTKWSVYCWGFVKGRIEPIFGS
jgi:hypothetical protein